ncbi:MAG TPA: hypothetical protein VHR84_21380 [Terriglobales bacterium]|jgi:hypothetical protein|nr:hypothetical protein [Terriglobales bacterium]
MLSKCANPDCSESFLYLHRGKLFRWERRSPPTDTEPLAFEKKSPLRIEYFWLCDTCATQLTVVRTEKGITVTPVDPEIFWMAS